MKEREQKKKKGRERSKNTPIPPPRKTMVGGYRSKDRVVGLSESTLWFFAPNACHMNINIMRDVQVALTISFCFIVVISLFDRKMCKLAFNRCCLKFCLHSSAIFNSINLREKASGSPSLRIRKKSQSFATSYQSTKATIFRAEHSTVGGKWPIGFPPLEINRVMNCGDTEKAWSRESFRFPLFF